MPRGSRRGEFHTDPPAPGLPYSEYNPGESAQIDEAARILHLKAHRAPKPIVSKIGEIAVVVLPDETPDSIVRRWEAAESFSKEGLKTEEIPPTPEQYETEFKIAIATEYRRIFNDHYFWREQGGGKKVDWDKEQLVHEFGIGGRGTPAWLQAFDILMSSDGQLIKCIRRPDGESRSIREEESVRIVASMGGNIQPLGNIIPEGTTRPQRDGRTYKDLDISDLESLFNTMCKVRKFYGFDD